MMGIAEFIIGRAFDPLAQPVLQLRGHTRESRSPDEAKRNPGPVIPPVALPRIALRFIRATITRTIMHCAGYDRTRTRTALPRPSRAAEPGSRGWQSPSSPPYLA